MIKEKNLFEKIFDCELESTINNDSKGIFYFDNGHSFDKGECGTDVKKKFSLKQFCRFFSCCYSCLPTI